MRHTDLPSRASTPAHAAASGTAVSYADVEEAAERIDGIAHRTPVHTSSTLDRRYGARFFFKCENLQRAGAFKFRGAFYTLSRLSDEAKRRGVLTYSSGNHAQALALAGRLLGVPTTVIMPTDAPAVKREAALGYGAEIVPYDREETTREELASRLSKERGLPIIPPYDHPHIVAGQGTVVREFLEEVGPLDFLLVCCGGGGLLSGSAVAAKALQPSCRVIGVEPERADDATQSFRTGTLHRVSNPDTIADGARTPSLGRITFPLILEHVDDMVTVTEEAIITAMHFLWERMKLVVEPTGAVAAAAVFDGLPVEQSDRVGIIISGGNVEMQAAAALFRSIGL